MAHTRGPWKTDEDKHDQPYLSFEISSVHRMMPIANVWQDDACFELNGEQRSNANLIAESPIMLAEMESLAKALEDTGHEPPQSFYDTIKRARGL